MVLRKMMTYLYYNVYIKVFKNYSIELERAVGGCSNLLDVGCGKDSPVKRFSSKLHCVGVDAWKPAIEESRKKGIHEEYHQIGVMDIGKKFRQGSFDCVVALDLIEHLTKEDGQKLLAMMEKIARKKVIVYTPNGFFPQEGYEDNPFQEHKSGWTVTEMRKRGYKVIGCQGWKALRTERARMRFWPKYFWLIISDITQFYVRDHPEHAFEILCIKTKGRVPK